MAYAISLNNSHHGHLLARGSVTANNIAEAWEAAKIYFAKRHNPSYTTIYVNAPNIVDATSK